MAWFGGNGTLGAPTTPAGSEGGATSKGRKRPPGAPILGYAVNREDLAASQLKATTPPPSVLEDASSAIGGAKSAAERQRKRAAAGSTRPTMASSIGAPTARLTPKSLIGS